MATLTFKTLNFQEKREYLEVSLLKLFSLQIPKEELEKIGHFRIKNANSIEFLKNEQEKSEIKFSFLLDKYLKNLKNKLTGNKATYIHKNSGIPLIGNVAFGIVYRNSSIIEIKPITSCNLNCCYCSIAEGLESKKNDFVVEKDYLVEELQKLLDFVADPVEVHLGVQGEPFLYADIEELIVDLQKMKIVKKISVDTNGTLLSKERIDRLSKHHKLQLNFSLDALEGVLAQKMAGTKNYNLHQVLETIKYASEKIKVIIAPVLVPGYNEKEMEKIIIFIKSWKKQPLLGIQNFLQYKAGKNPAKSLPWEKFYALIDEWEDKYKIKLKWSKEDFEIKKTKELPKPFQAGEVVNAVLKCPDRFPETSIAVAKERNISIPNCPFKKEKKVKVKILRDKHNIFVGKLV